MASFSGQEEHSKWNANLSKQLMAGHVQNIVNTYQRATPELIRGGNEWYDRANEVANSIGGGDVRRGAGILAALSPRTDWKRNIDLAHQLIKTGNAATMGANVLKARRIHEGEDPLEVLGGHKVTNFFHNIHNPNDPQHVTIDTHAVNLAVGNPFVGQGGKQTGEKPTDAEKVFGAAGRYNHFVHAYKRAAGELEVGIPNKVQAVTWVTHRGTIG
jgi:hypothetical protein